jgi:hypothetical protein
MAASNVDVVRVWQDDPMSGAEAVEVPAPKLRSGSLRANLTGRAPAAKPYEPGTAGFRYWACAGAVGRGIHYWTSHLPKGTSWQVGASLPVHLDEGVDLNAYYSRKSPPDTPGLHFFHDRASDVNVYSGESPDVVCHELGHAVLDALRPQLWDAMSGEVAAFHESFGDMSAMLTALQLPSMRAGLLAETAGNLASSSRLSRLAEQLGWAIRFRHPDAVDPDCLRNAVNSFFYRPPEALPPTAPASSLSSEPHSFSRLFTAAFLEAMAGMVAMRSSRSKPDDKDLASVSNDAGDILVDAITSAPVTAQYFAQVAVHMLTADGRLFKGANTSALTSAFVRRGILSLETAAFPQVVEPVTGTSRRMAALTGPDASPSLTRVAISGQRAGLGDRAILVEEPAEPGRIQARSSLVASSTSAPVSSESAANSFFEFLVRRGRIDFGDLRGPLVQPHVRKTHVLVPEGDALALLRRRFDCGFDPL